MFTLWWTNILPWKITIFNGKIHYKWPFSIAFCMFTRGYQRVDQGLAPGKQMGQLVHWWLVIKSPIESSRVVRAKLSPAWWKLIRPLSRVDYYRYPIYNWLNLAHIVHSIPSVAHDIYNPYAKHGAGIWIPTFAPSKSPSHVALHIPTTMLRLYMANIG